MSRTEKLYDIGNWIGTEDGLGQVLYNRNLYYEEFDLATGNYKKGEFKRTVYICKILCDFEGKIKSRFKVDLYTSIDLLDKIENEYISKLKLNFPDQYNKYLLFEPKENLTRQVFLEYNINKDELAKVRHEINHIYNRLPRTFTFKEFKKSANASELPFKISNFIKYNEKKDRSNCITIRLDSDLYKTKGKEALFRDIAVIKL